MLLRCFYRGTIVFCRHYTDKNILKLHERGIFKDVFPAQRNDEIVELLVRSPQTVYAGFDPTASSLHIGNLLILINLLHWQRAGHQVIALIGGATAQVGDPSGKTKDREKQDVDVIQTNTKGIEKNIRTIFQNHQKHFWKDGGDTLKPPVIVNNLSWYKSLNVIDFMNHIARSFRMGDMLKKQSVVSRLQSDQGMNYTEFSYQIFQSYDWVHLYKEHNCRFQVGGSDQMGNIKAGHDLVSKLYGKTVFGLTTPIIQSESGEKFGKSARNAVWLDPKLSSPFELYQYLFRTPDSDVYNLLKLFSFDTLPQIEDFRRKDTKPEERKAQTKLAEDVTLLVHGEEGLASALASSRALYSQDLDSLGSLNALDASKLFPGARVVELLLEPGMSMRDVSLVTKCFPREKEANQTICEGGFYVNYKKAQNPDEVISPSAHILPNSLTLLRVGKRNYCIVKWLS
uniref:Tyrosine--tRNA ligase n=1 Tax=Cacopsylla melanoneura TaxID=428564 RepID=A0A8D8VLW0_9HEMI